MAASGDVADRGANVEETRAYRKDVSCMWSIRIPEAAFPVLEVPAGILLVSRNCVKSPKMLTSGQLERVPEIGLENPQVCPMIFSTFHT